MRTQLPLIHIGSNKAASTTLQRHLFPRLSQIVYLGEDCADYSSHQAILQSMLSDDDFNFDHQSCRKLFLSKVELAKNSDKRFLYSSEDIMSSRVPSQVLNRLKSFLPQAEILVILRNQLDAIPSWYANHGAYLKGVPRRYWRSYVGPDEFMDHCLNFFNYSPLDAFMYHKIIGRYGDVFGDQNIKILFFEDFKSNRQAFLKDLSDVLGISEGEVERSFTDSNARPRVSQRRHLLHKWSGTVSLLKDVRFPQSVEKFIDAGPRASHLGMDGWIPKLSEIYGHENYLLQKRFGLDLERRGYPVRP